MEDDNEDVNDNINYHELVMNVRLYIKTGRRLSFERSDCIAERG